MYVFAPSGNDIGADTAAEAADEAADEDGKQEVEEFEGDYGSVLVTSRTPQRDVCLVLGLDASLVEVTGTGEFVKLTCSADQCYGQCDHVQAVKDHGIDQERRGLPGVDPRHKNGAGLRRARPLVTWRRARRREVAASLKKRGGGMAANVKKTRTCLS